MYFTDFTKSFKNASFWTSIFSTTTSEENYEFFPKQCLHYGVLTCNKGCLEVSWGRPPSTFMKNVAKTLGNDDFSKKKVLGLQCGGRSTNGAAATATSKSQNLIKPMKY